MNTKLYIGNLPKNLTRNELLNHLHDFADYITATDFGVDRMGSFLGYCYLTLNSESIASKLIAKMHHSKLKNKKIRITFCKCRHHTYDKHGVGNEFEFATA
jgi:RNA recognition motif-containing protein